MRPTSTLQTSIYLIEFEVGAGARRTSHYLSNTAFSLHVASHSGIGVRYLVRHRGRSQHGAGCDRVLHVHREHG